MKPICNLYGEEVKKNNELRREINRRDFLSEMAKALTDKQ